MPNVWKCKVVDQWGAEREYTCRGPESEPEMRGALARGILDAQRRRAWETGVEFPKGDPFPELPTNPGKHIVSVTPAGSDQTSDLGDWKPSPVPSRPFDVNRYANRDPNTGEPLFVNEPVAPAVAEKGAGKAVKNAPAQ